jgi:hypothetical protein
MDISRPIPAVSEASVAPAPTSENEEAASDEPPIETARTE